VFICTRPEEKIKIYFLIDNMNLNIADFNVGVQHIDVWTHTFLKLDQLEVFLGNATFLTLFFTMFLYWIETAFFNPATQRAAREPVYTSALVSDANVVKAPSPKGAWQNARNAMLISNLLLVGLLLVRWENSGHFPLSNLYESLMFLAWCCTFLHLILSNTFSIYIEKIFGSIISPSAFLMNAFATYTLPQEMQQAAPLVPALKSNWLMMHVTVMIISYATLIIGSLLSIAYLILYKIATQKKPSPFGASYPNSSGVSYRSYPEGVAVGSAVEVGSNPMIGNTKPLMGLATPVSGSLQVESPTLDSPLLKLITKLDFLSYRIIGLGFPFLTIGILSGAVWANEAWGSYWSWDPKETWALLTWLVFAIYLHTRLTKGWQGEKPAIIASLGFMVVWFCYLGVNLIGEGLHSYGFFKL
jgi:cytochrome c-type biogenesis protein CcsB